MIIWAPTPPSSLLKIQAKKKNDNIKDYPKYDFQQYFPIKFCKCDIY